MKNTTKYSDKELEMIKQLSNLWYGLIINNKDENFEPPTVYSILGVECFTYNTTGPAVESLRRCLLSFRESKIYRRTPEWDNLIQL